MKKLTSAEIRQSFLDFFQRNDHLVVPSASLVPHDDPTLLFTNAGMNQFKDGFLGLSAPPAPRVADVQKCMRVSGKHNDLEEVGPSPYHHTFFEMLGNWSFGDYYKQEAIAWAWELLTDVWGFSGERLYATVFKDEKGEIETDEEAVGHWKRETGINPAHILYFGRKDNFWEMGETGPCGPCSEIHFDRGPDFCNMPDIPGHECRVNGDCRRFVELWNLVFIQYNSLGGGRLEPLPAKHVDTGAGFDRLVMVMQERRSTYDTDVFDSIFRRTQMLANHTDAQREQHNVAYRVVADHCRAAAFLLGDGVLPGNVGRGYVLRMIIRRAARFGRKMGFTRPFMTGVVEAVIETMGGHYRELQDRRDHILKMMTQEEERFLKTLDLGLARLDEVLAQVRGDVREHPRPETSASSVEPLGSKAQSNDGGGIPGDVAFDLYATYGLPLEITRDVASEQGIGVDEAGFKAALEAHRQVSQGGPLATFGEGLAAYADLLETLKAEGKLLADGVTHNPYGELELQGPVLALIRAGERVSSARPGDVVEVVLPATPFYVEAGGQISDTGVIEGEGWEIRVTDTRRPLPGLILHVGFVVSAQPNGEVITGQPHAGDAAWVRVDAERRRDIMRNHTATHLLHRGLRRVLGMHVQQAGSLVAPDRLRFDFTHPATVTQDELKRIVQSVNDDILSDYSLRITHEPYQQALESGVIALFGEKYADVVRAIRIGDPAAPVSQELCGGTHVRATGEIGAFHIISEGSVGAGLRRIEAVTGRGAQQYVAERLGVLQQAAAVLDCPPTRWTARRRRCWNRPRRLKRRPPACARRWQSAISSVC